MKIYEKGYNRDNLDVFISSLREDEQVDDFFQYCTPALDAFVEYASDSYNGYNRSYY